MKHPETPFNDPVVKEKPFQIQDTEKDAKSDSWERVMIVCKKLNWNKTRRAMNMTEQCVHYFPLLLQFSCQYTGKLAKDESITLKINCVHLWKTSNLFPKVRWVHNEMRKHRRDMDGLCMLNNCEVKTWHLS